MEMLYTCVLENGSRHSGIVCVLNAKVAFLKFARLRFGGVVRLMSVTSGALFRIGDPEIRRPGIKIYSENLVVGTNVNWSCPFHLVLVGQWLRLSLAESRKLDKLFDIRPLVKRRPTNITL